GGEPLSMSTAGCGPKPVPLLFGSSILVAPAIVGTGASRLLLGTTTNVGVDGGFDVFRLYMFTDSVTTSLLKPIMSKSAYWLWSESGSILKPVPPAVRSDEFEMARKMKFVADGAAGGSTLVSIAEAYQRLA